jgi:uncharacterized OB-fold protein
MAETANTNPPASDAQGLLANLGIAGKQVCPFCGAVTDKPESACRRCTMENTPLTRQATRARIGPWYVMQSRNPSAPGMKFNTLLALIRRGQIAPRSVLRGPTTHQLWRFAIRVKGVSREFGHCYSCGGELQPTTAICPRCSKSQELPANPDALLETDTQGVKPVYVDVSPKPPATAERNDATPSASQTAPIEAQPSATQTSPSDETDPSGSALEASPPGNGDADRLSPADRPTAESSRPDASRLGEWTRSASRGVPATSRGFTPPSPAATMALVAGLPSPESAGPELQSRPRHQQLERILSPRELANAFSLQFNPNSDHGMAAPPPIPGMSRRAIVGLILFLLVAAGAAVIGFIPTLRTPALDRMRQAYHSLLLMTSPDTPSPVLEQPIQIKPSDRPAWATEPPNYDPPVGRTTADISTDGNSAAGAPIDTGLTSGGATPISPGNNSPGSADPNRTPAPRQNAAPAEGGSRPPLIPADKATGAAAIAPPSSQELDTLAMTLRSNGLDAESHHDYVTAISCYQQIEKLPRDHWPSDTEQLLQTAIQRVRNIKPPAR